MGTADDILFAPIGASTDIRIPDAWIDVITKIRTVSFWKTATIAGGALRDLENGRQIKDVDIFLYYPGSNEDTRAELKSIPLGYDVLNEIPHNSHNTSQLGSAGISHFTFKKHGWNFEISQRDQAFDYKTLLDAFDIGLCMISLDEQNRIYRTPEYKNDMKNKSITIVRATGGREQSHAERIQDKYNNWTIVPL